MLAIDPELCDMERVRDFMPELGELTNQPARADRPGVPLDAGSFWSLLEEGGGVWGKPSESTAEKGEEFLEWCTEAVVNLVHDMETCTTGSAHDRVRQPRA